MKGCSGKVNFEKNLLPEDHLKIEVNVKVTSRLAVYHQSVHSGVKPLENHDQRIFFSTQPLQS
jgi:hypothetical protein